MNNILLTMKNIIKTLTNRIGASFKSIYLSIFNWFLKISVNFTVIVLKFFKWWKDFKHNDDYISIRDNDKFYLFFDVIWSFIKLYFWGWLYWLQFCIVLVSMKFIGSFWTWVGISFVIAGLIEFHSVIKARKYKDYN